MCINVPDARYHR